MKKIITKQNWKNRKEYFTQGKPSKQVVQQDAALSLQQLVERSQQGIPPPLREGEYYDGDHESEDLEKIPTLDPIEREELVQRHARKVKQIEEKLQKKKEPSPPLPETEPKKEPEPEPDKKPDSPKKD